jgi:hypothetical protein
MYIEISLSFGGKALAQVVEWGLMEYDEEETWGWPKKGCRSLFSFAEDYTNEGQMVIISLPDIVRRIHKLRVNLLAY